MSLFKDKKLKTVDVEVQGVNFTLTEPSALDLCLYFDAVDVEHAKVDKNSTRMFKAKINAITGLLLTSICLQPHFPNKSQDEIYQDLCNELTDYADVNKFIEAAESIALKMETEEEESDGSSPTD